MISLWEKLLSISDEIGFGEDGDGDDDDGWLGFEGFEGCGEMWGEDSFIDLLYVYLFLFFLLFCRV